MAGRPPRHGGARGGKGPRDGGSRSGGGPPRGGGRGRDAVGGGPEAPGPGDRNALYGRNAVHEALRAGRRTVRSLQATAATLASEAWLREAGATVAESEELTARAGTTDHQGVVAAVDGYPYVSLKELLAQPNPLIVALDEVQDPQNLGAIARTAECVGATGMLICRHRAAEVTPSAVKASAGAVEHLRIAQVRNLSDALTEAQKAGCWIYGAAGDADGAVPYGQPDYSGGVVLVMGAEGTGLRSRVRDTCDALIALPLRGQIDSLNVSAASAALLYAILQQREGLDSGT